MLAAALLVAGWLALVLVVLLVVFLATVGFLAVALLVFVFAFFALVLGCFLLTAMLNLPLY